MEDLRNIQQLLLEMTIDFDKYCRERNIVYYLAYGSCLGAVRHNGFIPWDDDIDVWMLPDDFIRFRALNIQNYNTIYFHQNKITEKNYYLTFDKIRRRNTSAIDVRFLSYNVNQGIFIDVFPLYYLPDNIVKKIWFYILFFLYKYANLIIVYNSEYYFKTLIGKFARIVVNLFSIKNINKLCLFFQKELLKFPKSKYLIDLEQKPVTKFYTEDFLATINCDFNHTKFSIPKGYDRILKMIYGNYMKLPKVEDRYNHSEYIYDVNVNYEKKIKILKK